MNKPAIIAALLFACATARAADTSAASAWLAQIGGKGAEVVMALTETTDHRVCATGTYWVDAQFGTGDNAVKLNSEDAHEIFVACYRADGELAFARPLRAASGDGARAVAALPGGDLVVTGYRTASPSAATGNNSYQGADLFLIRLDSNGNEVWSRRLGGRLADSGNALSVTASGDILVAGSFADVIRIPLAGKQSKLVSAGVRDAMVVKFSDAGDVIWARRFGGAADDQATAIHVDRTGSVLVAGTFRAALTVGDTTVTAHGFRDVFVLSLDANGEARWLQHLGGAQQDTVHGLVSDSLGRVHVAGNFQNAIGIGNEQLVSRGGTDVFIARYDRNGNLEQAQSIGGALTDQVFALAITRDDELLLSGHYQGEADLAPGPAEAIVSAATPSNSSGYVLRLDKHGAYRSATPLGGAGMEMALGLAALDDGGIAVAGLFNKDLTLPPLSVLTNRGKTDVFVLRLPPRQAVQLSRTRSPETVKHGW